MRCDNRIAGSIHGNSNTVNAAVPVFTPAEDFAVAV